MRSVKFLIVPGILYSVYFLQRFVNIFYRSYFSSDHKALFKNRFCYCITAEREQFNFTDDGNKRIRSITNIIKEIISKGIKPDHNIRKYNSFVVGYRACLPIFKQKYTAPYLHINTGLISFTCQRIGKHLAFNESDELKVMLINKILCIFKRKKILNISLLTMLAILLLPSFYNQFLQQ